MAKSAERTGSRTGASERRPRRSPYELIKQAILTSELASGEQLVEAELAARYNVSRTPVREALMRLQQDGLVSRLDRTLTVRTRSREEILDIYDTRIVLEAHAARLAAERRTNNDLLLLNQFAKRMSAEMPKDEDVMADLNRDFHRRVWQCGRSETVIDLLERINLHLARYPATTLSFPGRWEQANAEHDELLVAIRDRDVERAGDIATAHFSRARDIRLQVWMDED